MIWSKIDLDGNGKIDITEWNVATINKENALTMKKLRSAFNLFDEDGSGCISAEELKKAMGSFIGETYSDKIWQKMIQEVDSNGNGEIDFEEFVDMMNVFLENHESLS